MYNNSHNYIVKRVIAMTTHLTFSTSKEGCNQNDNFDDAPFHFNSLVVFLVHLHYFDHDRHVELTFWCFKHLQNENMNFACIVFPQQTATLLKSNICSLGASWFRLVRQTRQYSLVINHSQTSYVSFHLCFIFWRRWLEVG